MGVSMNIMEDGCFTLAVNGDEQWKRLDDFLEKYKPKTTKEFSEMLKRMAEKVKTVKRDD